MPRRSPEAATTTPSASNPEAAAQSPAAKKPAAEKPAPEKASDVPRPFAETFAAALAKRKMKLNELSEAIGISVQNLSILKTGKAKAIRFSTLEALCRELGCHPGDILVWDPDEAAQSDDDAGHAVAAE